MPSRSARSPPSDPAGRSVPRVTTDCIFCAIVRGDAPSQRILEDDRTVAFMDINPATRGHALVVPRRHSRDVLDADDEDLAAVVLSAQRVARAAVEVLGADGVNLVQATGSVAFQTVFHLHFHVVPRYASDRVVLPWTPRPGDPADIAAAGEAIRSAL